ncbi:RDD family protein [Lamprobacter modestohalophilus]|uniref:RDD family protein n=1 Tax=Lamprobacter modestohalophilus TaxID=1064514 RepID=UPI002ADEF8E0|nr:RDD family protein [Lamprobacter modestohalophilus]MEA1048665.1 RDD family protein [Lamprobacter modestohalophilus]
MTDLSQTQGPGLLRRLAAILYDLLLVASVLFAAAFVYTILVQSLTGADLTQGVAGFLFQLYLIAVIVGYYLYFWTAGRQTLAMRAWRLLILREDGSPLSSVDALRRIGFAILTLAPAGLGLWWMLFDRDRLTWYDRLAGTRTLLLSKGARSATLSSDGNGNGSNNGSSSGSSGPSSSVSSSSSARASQEPK